jgi:hypothetical protein
MCKYTKLTGAVYNYYLTFTTCLKYILQWLERSKPRSVLLMNGLEQVRSISSAANMPAKTHLLKGSAA